MNIILKQLLIAMGEQVGIPVLLAIVQVELASNPTAAMTLRSVLLAFADAIYVQAGLTPPSHT